MDLFKPLIALLARGKLSGAVPLRIPARVICADKIRRLWQHGWAGVW
jgi:argonaute-like protein implicated in RNA metabolism and viral defense